MKKKVETIVRVILGLILLIFGLDKFFEFVPHGHVMTEELITAYHGLLANKFIMPSVGVVEFISGILLISGRYVIVALVAMIPVVFGILGFHLSVDLPGILPGLGVALMHIYLIATRREVIVDFIKQTDSI
ncbi:DoxX family membrane protein [Mangrovivirga cuniculi]|uniref:DoxX family protein n=1 Tax=Mangrovivirga cuniculi TaxID=2715131 RepID=A0A4D7JJ42_9BACT|nr:DoxX family membrane protein [Mangrovivirga cuniculi]QCK15601.1 DoxX family protein [Mangrovivirga cuniculi]